MAGTRRRWGWHELRPEWADRLVGLAGVAPGDIVLDIGAGRGMITRSLLEHGARVIAVELHPGRAQALRVAFGREVIVVQHDAADLRLPGRPFSVVASLPYKSSSPILRRLLHSGSQLVEAHVVVQAQAAARWASPAAPGAARWQRVYRTSVGVTVPRRAFVPPPRVDSRVLAVRRVA